MLSSKNKDKIPGLTGNPVSLSDVRKRVKKELEGTELFGERLFDAWINEEAGAGPGTDDAWDECMAQVDDCDILVAIYNGDAGWTLRGGDLGICHAEFDRAWSKAPAKVRLIRLRFESDKEVGLTDPEQAATSTKADERFHKALERTSLLEARVANDGELVEAVTRTVVGAVKLLTVSGAREARRGKFHLGAPLDWSRLSYVDRKGAIEHTIHNYLEQSLGAEPEGTGHVVQMGPGKVFLESHGVPSGFSVPEAREMVGRPHLADHKRPPAQEKLGLVGPVHMIGCHKSVTETQLTKFFGHPDIYIVETPFGYFVADQVECAQVLFLKDCRDEYSTRTALQRAFDWIDQAQEEDRILARAKSRANILQAIAAEIATETHG